MSIRKDTKNARITGGRLPNPDDKEITATISLYFKDENERNRVLAGISNARYSASLAYTFDLAERSGLSQSEFVEHLKKIRQISGDLAGALTGQRVGESAAFPLHAADKIHHALTIGIQMGGNPADDVLFALHALNERIEASLEELQRVEDGELAENRWISGIENARRSPGRGPGSVDVGLDRFLLEMIKVWTDVRDTEIIYTVDQEGNPKDEFFDFLEKYFTTDNCFKNDKSYWARALQERCRGLTARI